MIQSYKETSIIRQKFNKLEEFMNKENIQLSVGHYGRLYFQHGDITSRVVDGETLHDTVDNVPSMFETKLIKDSE